MISSVLTWVFKKSICSEIDDAIESAIIESLTFKHERDLDNNNNNNNNNDNNSSNSNNTANYQANQAL